MWHRNSLRLIAIAVLTAALLLSFVSCDESDDNNNNPPTTGTLTGTLIMHGEWPDSGAVQVSVFENWNTGAANCSWCVEAAGGPPAYYTAQGYLIDPDPNNLVDPDTVEFEITGVTLATYGAVVLGWRAPTVSDIHCDEPVIGMYGASPFTNDSLPDAVTFSSSNATQTIEVHAYMDHFLPVPGCDDRGRIEGTLDFGGSWPTEGVLVMVTAVEASGWQPVMAQPIGYDFPTQADPTFRFLPQFGTYYLSIWTNAQPPAPLKWYGSYGVNTAAGDAHPNPIVLDETTPALTGFTFTGTTPAPHYIAGNVSFTGTRPAEGLLVLLSTFMYSPEHPPQGAPTAYFPITIASETLYAFSGLAEGTYYASLWTNTPPPGQPAFFGAYGYASGSDPDPDPIVIDGAANYGRTGIVISN